MYIYIYICIYWFVYVVIYVLYIYIYIYMYMSLPMDMRIPPLTIKTPLEPSPPKSKILVRRSAWVLVTTQNTTTNVYANMQWQVCPDRYARALAAIPCRKLECIPQHAVTGMPAALAASFVTSNDCRLLCYPRCLCLCLVVVCYSCFMCCYACVIFIELVSLFRRIERLHD